MDMFEDDRDEQREEEIHRKVVDAHPPGFAEVTGEVTDENGNSWNPRLHLELHKIARRQIDEWDLAANVFDKLTEEWGLHEHAAIHALGGVTTDILFDVMQEPDDADRDALSDKYNKQHAEKLRDLLEPETERHQRFVEPFTDGQPPTHKEIR